MTLLITEAISSPDIFDESSAYAETKIIPSLTVSERYDSNAWFTPSDRIPPGRKQWDFVTAVTPLVQVLNKNRQAVTSLSAGVSGNAFVNNTDFSYISTNAVVSSDLSGWVGELIRGANLQVSDTFLYTPEPPAFLTGVQTSGQPLGTSDVLSRGIVGVRANTFSNTASVTGDYALSRRISLRGNYNNSIFRVGQILAQPTETTTDFPLVYFNTNLQTVSAGPRYRLTRGDSLGLNYQGTYVNFSGGGTSSSFSAQGLIAEYSKVTPDWTVTISGGPTVIDPGNDLFFAGRVQVTGVYDQSTRVALAVLRQAGAAFFGSGGALISNTGQISLVRELSKVLTLTVSANYAYNVTAPVEVVRYETFIGIVRLDYKVMRTLVAALSYDYNYYNYTQPGIPMPQGQFLFDRNVVMFSITNTWN